MIHFDVHRKQNNEVLTKKEIQQKKKDHDPAVKARQHKQQQKFSEKRESSRKIDSKENLNNCSNYKTI